MSSDKTPPAGTRLLEEVALLVWRPEGVINEATVNQIIDYLANLEMRRKQPFNRFIDTGLAEAVDLNFRYIFHISLFRRLSYRGPAVQTAIVAADDAISRYFKLHELLTQGSAIEVRHFKEYEPAAAWLKVPVEALQST